MQEGLVLSNKRKKALVVYSPQNCNKYSHKIKTISDIFKLPSKTLGEFKRELGRDWVIAYLEMWLIELNDSSNVKTKMSSSQIQFTAERIYESYSLKITDLTLFFRNIKEGVYGQFYETLGTEKIMEWLRVYYDLRCEYGQMQAQSKKNGFSLSKDKVDLEVLKKMFNGVGDVEVNHNHEKNGIGTRVKRVLTVDLPKKIKSYKTKELIEYLTIHDYNSNTYDEAIYKLIESEIDLRNIK